jgi:hypothetical protein
MATIEEQQKLLDTLKFTPCKYQISMWGYGGEIVMGTIERKIFDYFKHRRISVSDFAWDYDAVEELNIPEEMIPFEPGSWYECDRLAHSNGVSRDSGTIQITDENGETVLERSLEDIDGTDIGLCCDNEAWIGMAEPGEVVFIGRSNEKGTFFEGEIELTAPLDIEKLVLYYDDIDGEDFVSMVYYNDVEIENSGSNTNGKSSDFGFFLVKEDKSWERYVDYDSIEYPTTNWFPKKVNPVYVGHYEIETAGKESHKYQAKWTGSKWVSAWADETEYNDPTKEIKIKQWRGITYDPDADITMDQLKKELDEISAELEKPEMKQALAELKANPNAKWPF